jgi:UDP-glucose/GDP-mannose dehydrogenase family, UDP binding domain
VLTEWDEFKTLDYAKIYKSMAKPAFVFDGRNIVDSAALREIGFEVRVTYCYCSCASTACVTDAQHERHVTAADVQVVLPSVMRLLLLLVLCHTSLMLQLLAKHPCCSLHSVQ